MLKNRIPSVQGITAALSNPCWSQVGDDALAINFRPLGMERLSPGAYAGSLVGVAAVTGGLWLFRHSLDKSHFGLIYLLLVVTIAVRWGTWPAIMAAGLSFFAWNYFFFHPLMTFEVSDPRDWLLLMVYLITAVMTGTIAGRMRAREVQAIAREEETAGLCRAILAVGGHGSLQPLLEQAQASLRARGCAIMQVTAEPSDTVVSAVGQVIPLNQDAVRRAMGWSMARGSGDTRPGREIFIPVTIRAQVGGVFYVNPGPDTPSGAPLERLLAAFASAAGTLLEHRQLLEEAAHAEALQEAERLKSLLISSLTHGLKTPIASLSATLDTLKQAKASDDSAQVREAILHMSEEVGLLTETTDNVLGLAQLESGGWRPQLQWVAMDELVEAALRRLPEPDSRRVVVSVPADLPVLRADPVQLTQMVRHLVENALNYSPPGRPVRIGAESRPGGVEFWVDDQGPGIPPRERGLIFQRFYRGEAAVRMGTRGTGLGLTLCREIILAHAGSIRVEDAPSGGARLAVFLPRPAPGAEVEIP